MYVFLMRDTARSHPMGYDESRRNLFDPEEDLAAHIITTVEKQDCHINNTMEKATVSPERGETDPVPIEKVIGLQSQVSNEPEQLLLQKQYVVYEEGEEVEEQGPEEVQDEEAENEEDDGARSEEQPSKCGRIGCYRSPRFDSVFCSDACGVSALESDLLRALNYASDLHPSLFRG
jgi:hypothetical protein